MIAAPVAEHLGAVGHAASPFLRFLATSRWASRRGCAEICDFVVGNPHEMPLPAYVDAIRRASVPRDPSWFGYKLNEPGAREAAARSLRERLGIPYEPGDIFLTKGASSALAVALTALCDPGDEVIYVCPPWFFYEPMIAFVHAVPKRVDADSGSFDLDPEAIAAAITPRTRAVIVNSPNNPTGRIYPPETLARLGAVLTGASEAHGRAIALISDESYNRIVFDGCAFSSPTAYYPHSFLVYSYAKALLTPGQRLGYLALAPAMPDRERIREAVLLTQCAGYGFPDAVLQHALPELEGLCIDLGALQRRRDVLAGALREQGYDVALPEGAWYVLPRSPLADDAAFAELLAAQDVFVLPGSIVELPGYLRIALTASDAMVERSFPAFERALAAVRSVRAA